MTALYCVMGIGCAFLFLVALYLAAIMEAE